MQYRPSYMLQRCHPIYAWYAPSNGELEHAIGRRHQATSGHKLRSKADSQKTVSTWKLPNYSTLRQGPRGLKHRMVHGESVTLASFPIATDGEALACMRIGNCRVSPIAMTENSSLPIPAASLASTKSLGG